MLALNQAELFRCTCVLLMLLVVVGGGGGGGVVPLILDPIPISIPSLRPKLFFSGRLSFHPIPCGSRDRPAGRKVIAY